MENAPSHISTSKGDQVGIAFNYVHDVKIKISEVKTEGCIREDALRINKLPTALSVNEMAGTTTVTINNNMKNEDEMGYHIHGYYEVNRD